MSSMKVTDLEDTTPPSLDQVVLAGGTHTHFVLFSTSSGYTDTPIKLLRFPAQGHRSEACAATPHDVRANNRHGQLPRAVEHDDSEDEERQAYGQPLRQPELSPHIQARRSVDQDKTALARMKEEGGGGGKKRRTDYRSTYPPLPRPQNPQTPAESQTGVRWTRFRQSTSRHHSTILSYATPSRPTHHLHLVKRGGIPRALEQDLYSKRRTLDLKAPGKQIRIRIDRLLHHRTSLSAKSPAAKPAHSSPRPTLLSSTRLFPLDPVCYQIRRAAQFVSICAPSSDPRSPSFTVRMAYGVAAAEDPHCTRRRGRAGGVGGHEDIDTLPNCTCR
ncbi:hypothetical protein R3P38DRAFT_3273270 [Favolaschia claudopus]|uniref:Uncharacterized protein n=1 Tax=Favolaschia claudopus TaxID=2862362 RepID=A0AAW0B1Z5_9AGAR